MKSSKNKENIDKLVFHWDKKSSSLSTHIRHGKKPSIREYLEFLEEMNRHNSKKQIKIVVYKNTFALM